MQSMFYVTSLMYTLWKSLLYLYLESGNVTVISFATNGSSVFQLQFVPKSITMPAIALDIQVLESVA